MYLNVGDSVVATLIGEWVFKHLAASGKTWAMLGDFNCTAEESPTSYISCSGMARLGDDVRPNDIRPTRKGGNRVIDYLVHAPEIYVADRIQDLGVGDHYVVAYAIRQEPIEQALRRRPCRKLPRQEPIDESEWEIICLHCSIGHNMRWRTRVQCRRGLPLQTG